MKKRYTYKPTIFKIGDTVFKKINENKFTSIKNKNGFTITLNFQEDKEIKQDNNVIDEINNILIGSLFK